MRRVKSINIFVFLVLVATLCTMGAWYLDITPLRWASYISECLLIIYCLFSSHNIGRRILLQKEVIITSVILIINFLLSVNEPSYTDLLKYFGYLSCFMYGNYLAHNYETLKTNNILLYSLILIPVVAVAFFDHSILKNLFFRTPNGFVYFGVSMALLYALIKGHNTKSFIKSIIILAAYILICTSLGVVVAAFATYLLLNLNRSKFKYLIIGGVAFIFAIFFDEIPLFVRFRDVFAVWGSLSADEWKNIQDVSSFELSQRIDASGERTDTASSIWRLIHWIDLIKQYIVNIWSIPFGLGAGFSEKVTGYDPHNDFLLILVEYGLIIFTYFVKLIKNVYERMKCEKMLIYFLLTMFFYHFTENLIDNFPPNTILYFTVGWCVCKYDKKEIVVKNEMCS